MPFAAPDANLPVEKRFSVCEHVLRLGDLAQDIEAAVTAGARGLSLNAADFGDITIADARRLLDDSGLAITSFIDPAVMRLGPEPPDLGAVERTCEAAAGLGAPCLLFIAGELGDRRPDDADEALGQALAVIADRVADTGVRPMLEPLHPVARDLSYVHTIEHALAITGPVRGAGIVVDVGASWWERDLVELVAANIESVLAVQITDVRADDLARRTYVRERCSAESAVPVAELVRAFVEAGYAGWFEHEVLVTFDRRTRCDMVHRDRLWFEGLWAEGTASALSGGGGQE